MQFKIGQYVLIDGPYGPSPLGVIVSRNFHQTNYEVSVKGRVKHEFVDEYFLIATTPKEAEIYEVIHL